MLQNISFFHYFPIFHSLTSLHSFHGFFLSAPLHPFHLDAPTPQYILPRLHHPHNQHPHLTDLPSLIDRRSPIDVVSAASFPRRCRSHRLPSHIDRRSHRSDAVSTASLFVAMDFRRRQGGKLKRQQQEYVIRIKAGVYRENVEISKKKTNIMFVGDGRRTTIITANRNVVDGSTTFHSATVAAVGERFLARDITFQNSAGPSKHQAVALRVGSDLSAFYRCDILAYQDTLYVHSNRHFFVQCLITGTVDFIFGNGAAVFQDCDIHARRPNSNQRNMVTAQGRTDPNQNTGIVLHRCRIGATSDLRAVQGNFQTYLGRPWKEYSRTVIMHSTISEVIHPQGWHEWDGNYALNTLYYGEYQNTGPGAATSSRVGWRGYRVITSATEAQRYTVANFIAGGSWLSSTGFPFTLGA